jgi:hypothetical protein
VPISIYVSEQMWDFMTETKLLFKDDIGSCTEAKFIVSDWGDTMKQRPKCCETAMKKYYETAPIIICESQLYTPKSGTIN